MDLQSRIRSIPDYPNPGITFFDITPVLGDGASFIHLMHALTDPFRDMGITKVAGIEARGFVLASAMAYELGLGLLVLRKSGKLPGETDGEDYSLEYGASRIEVHRDTVVPGKRVLVVDDLLATGGTAAAAARLLARLGAELAGWAFMVELAFLEGRGRLDGDVFSLIRYDE